MMAKESRMASLLGKNVKSSLDKFLRKSTREGMGKNVTQPKGDSIQVTNRSK